MTNHHPTGKDSHIITPICLAVLWHSLRHWYTPKVWGKVWGWIVALGGSLLLGGCAASWLPTYPVTRTPTDCPLRIPDDLIENETIFCGYLRVPQDRAHPQGLQIALPYALIRAESAHPRPDPLIYIVGGPGGSALAEFSELYPRLRPLRRERDLIFYDQRGTILAQPVLDCVTDARPQDAAELTTAIIAAEAQTPTRLHPLDANDAAVAACAQRLHAAGINLAFYDTTTHARDLIDLAWALRYTRYNLYGASYGTRIALEVMRLGASGLRAVVLDAVDPPVIDTYVAHTALATWEAIGQTLTACAKDSRCAEAFPTLVAAIDLAIDRDGHAYGPLYTVIDALNTSPLPLPLDRQPQVTGDDLIGLLLARFEPALAPYLPKLIDELAQRKTETLVGLLAGSLPPPPPRPATIPLVESENANAFLLDLNGAVLLQLAALDAPARAEWLRLTVRNTDRQRLTRFIQTYLPMSVAQPLLDQLAALDDAELAQVFAGLQGLPPHPLTTGANLAVECRDELPFNDYATVISAHHTAAIRDAVVAQSLAELRHFWAQCALFPTGTAPITQSEPVTSPVPTLILQGALDDVTPPSWARAAHQSLANGVYLEFPGQGHIVIEQPLSATSGCPVQIVRSFLAEPLTMPETECIAEVYRLSWALPAAP